MLITITSNTANYGDDGVISDIKPLDFVLSYHHGVVTYYSLYSTFTTTTKSDRIWHIIKEGSNDGYGMDTALSRFITTITITGKNENKISHNEVHFKIVLNHYDGPGESTLLNKVIHEMSAYRLDIQQEDIDFLNFLSGYDKNADNQLKNIT